MQRNGMQIKEVEDYVNLL